MFQPGESKRDMKGTNMINMFMRYNKNTTQVELQPRAYYDRIVSIATAVDGNNRMVGDDDNKC